MKNVITLVKTLRITNPTSLATEFCPSLLLTNSIFLANATTHDLIKYNYLVMSHYQLPLLLVEWSEGEIRTHAVSYKNGSAYQRSTGKRVCIKDTLIGVGSVAELFSLETCCFLQLEFHKTLHLLFKY